MYNMNNKSKKKTEKEIFIPISLLSISNLLAS